jgi:alkylation response protein AidB-like acyl-CoA dehydrogenase
LLTGCWYAGSSGLNFFIFVDRGDVMNFDFSDEQKELQTQARRFLSEQCPTSLVREILEGDAPYAGDLWTGMAEMGFQGAAIPEAYGGVGYGYLELCVIAEEIGRVVAPVPFSSSVYLAAEALLQAGTEAQKEAYLSKIASGESIGTLAFAEGIGRCTADNCGTTFEGGKVSGRKVPVADGDVADFAVVVTQEGLVLVDLNGEGVSREAVSTVDPTRSHASITFSNAAGELLGEGGCEALEVVLNRAAVLMAFEQVGGASVALEMAVGYAKERYAFGRPIGSFQGLKHKMADMYVKNELARSNAYYGAWALSVDAAELPLAAAGARVSASEAYLYASKENIQIHGGIGFTWEYDAQFYYRRAKLLSLALESSMVWKDKLVGALESEHAASAAVN